MNSDGPYVCSQYSKLRPESIQLQCSGIVPLFYSFLFWILILIKFKCLYVAGVLKKAYLCVTLSTHGKNEQTIVGTVNSSQLCSTKRSTRHTI